MPARSTRRTPPITDLLIGGALAVYAVVEVFVSDTASTQQVPLQVIVALATTLPILVRRDRPVEVLIVVSVLFGAKALLIDPMPELLAEALAFLVAIYTVGAECRFRSSLLLLGLASAAGILRSVAMPDQDLGGDLVNAAFGILAWAIGRLVRVLESRAVRSEQRVQVVEDWAAESSREAVTDERARIARELHDIVAHNIGVVLLHAGGGRRMLDHDVDQAREAFDTIEGAAGEALAEMRRLLHVLRSEHDPLTPQPGVGDLPALVSRVRSAGVDVSLAMDEQMDLSPGLSLCVYRIAQEATTNAVRHGHAGRISIDVHRDQDGGLLLEVVDDGTPVTGQPHHGHGIVGMRERVALFGGTLALGPRDTGGFAVRAHFPLELP